MPAKLVAGVYTAVLTPRCADESVDVPALRRLIEFQIEQGISSFALNGATGEFCLTTPAQLEVILSTVKDASQGKAQMLCGIGAAGSARAIELAAVAQVASVKALLLPMPYFFPYQQEDLDAFSRTVAASTPLPILLYNLPQFTCGLDQDTVRALITEVPNIIGIKDSSGSLEILRDLTRHGIDACRIVGNDSALAPAMLEGLCDGVVSGVACALPEAILALYAQAGATGSDAFKQASIVVEEFIEQLNPFPTPWALKWIAESRGLMQATFAQPVTDHRRAQAQTMAQWFTTWYPTAVESLLAAK